MNQLYYLLLTCSRKARLNWMLVAVLMSGMLATGHSMAQTATFPFPQTVTYANGVVPTTVSSADARAAYQSWKTNYLETCANGTVRVRFDDPAQTVSEGIGYGMILSAYYGDKVSFDGLFQYYNNHTNGNGIMNWKIQGCTNTILGNNGATDAELDVAFALVVADKQWGGYTAPATSLITKIKTFETTVVNGLHILKPGDAFGGTACTNASYFSPAYYRIFAAVVPADAVFWQNMARDTYVQIAANAHPITGLVSDWQRADNGTPGDAGCGANFAFQGRRYSYDAARTPWRIGVDYLWGYTNAKPLLDKLTGFVQGPSVGGIANVKDGYEQNGTTTGQFHTVPFVGGFAIAAMANSQTTANTFATDLKNINPQFDGYFGSSLRALYMLSLTGNFWNPATRSAAPVADCSGPRCLAITATRSTN